MSEKSEGIKALQRKLDLLLEKQAYFSEELAKVKRDLDEMSYGAETSSNPSQTDIPSPKPSEAQESKKKPEDPSEMERRKQEKAAPDFVVSTPSRRALKRIAPDRTRSGKKSDLEKFIGENLISKIGIVITIIGVAIGAKYSIEHELISPLARIILGYLAGIGLLTFGIKLKRKYENYSAVLVSGSIAIMYFITYAAYDFYALIPQLMAFAMMVIFTAAGVYAAIKYNQQVIAHIGLVGAYAVPFLLSDGSGKVAVLYSYMAIINIGILVIAFKRYWKSVNYSAFGLTWLIFLGWLATGYSESDHYSIALLFNAVFFLIFYGTFIAYKIIKKEEFNSSDVGILIINSFLFYFSGYITLSGHESGQHFLGVFTLINAAVHFGVSLLFYWQKERDQKVFYLLIGLSLVLFTIAIPVQLDGEWVTLLWAGLACVLFWIGKTKKTSFYERFAYPLMFLATASLMEDWATSYHTYYAGAEQLRIIPVLNIHFLNSLLFIAAFAFINNLHQKYGDASIPFKNFLKNLVIFALPAILLFAIYFGFYMEVSNYWSQLYVDSKAASDGFDVYASSSGNRDLFHFKTIWIVNYTMLFCTLLAIANFRKFKSRALAIANLVFMGMALGLFLTSALYALSELRDSYLMQRTTEIYSVGIYHISIRYISIGFFVLMLYVGYQYSKQSFLKIDVKVLLNLFLHTSALWILSSELIHLLEMAGTDNSYKLGLTILWGTYALFMVALGISRSKKHLRIAAFVLLGITIMKLFFYDISNLDTIVKTVVFVSLGILLLIISFLYNKFKQSITDEP